ncbi:MAG: chondroitinase-B domain-containing protein [Colwellia sp.]
MKKCKSALKKYFVITGLLANLSFFAGFGLLLNTMYSLELPLPLFSEKVRNNLSINQPNLLSVVSPVLDGMSFFQENNYYFRPLDITQWRGVGARKQNHLKPKNALFVFNEAELILALKKVTSGQTIVIAPGDYVIKQLGISLVKSGTKKKPIRVVAEQLGTVKIYLSGEGFVVNRPHWQFENLHLIGHCKEHRRCEHAFHVVGQGQYTVIKNNIIQDFNAMIKVNGIGNHYPDNGSVVQNTLFNVSPRKTKNPVTPIDLMHANYWRVAKNFIFDIQKSAGNEVSYAAFFKGGSSYGVFEQNLVICAANLTDQYTAIGLSLGGGGSNQAHRRGHNKAEHVGGIIRNNIIMHCSNDVGIYLNKAEDSIVTHNTLYNTLGIDIRFKESSADIFNNILSGRIKERDGGSFNQKNNVEVKPSFFTGRDSLSTYFKAPDIGDFTWTKYLLPNKSSAEIPPRDFCGKVARFDYIGAFSGRAFCVNKLNLAVQPEQGLY